jgi:hypothetical protein
MPSGGRPKFPQWGTRKEIVGKVFTIIHNAEFATWKKF